MLVSSFSCSKPSVQACLFIVSPWIMLDINFLYARNSFPSSTINELVDLFEVAFEKQARRGGRGAFL